MKKTLSAFVAILSFLPFIANAQWLGTSPGKIYYPYNNVGIGTTDPNGKLDIASSTTSGTSDVLTRYTWLGDLNNWGLRFEQQFNAASSRIQYNWIMRHSSTVDIPVMSFVAGKVGIGTTDPSNLLSVGKDFGNGTPDIQRYLNLVNGSSTSPANSNGVGMSFSVGNNYNPSAVLGAIDVVNEYYNSASNMRFYTMTGSALTEKMRMDGKGYLGIGTATPTQKLTVSTYGDGASVIPALRVEQYNDGSSEKGTVLQ